MSRSKNASSAATRISSFVLLIIFVTLILALVALALAFQLYNTSPEIATYWFLLGFIGLALSTYVLLQTRRRIMRLRIETPPVITTVECKKCSFKSVREFQRGDYVYKEVEPCQKCNEKMIITAIYREIREKGKTPSFPY